MNKGIIYARQSSGDEENSGSIAQQIDLCCEKAKQLNIEVIAVFQDANTSGKTYPTIWSEIAKQDDDFCNWCKTANKRQKQFRDGVSAAIEFSIENKIDSWLVIDSTRIHRSTENSFLANKFNQFFVNNHIEIVQVKGEKIDLRQFDQSLINQIRTAINDEQIRKSKEKSIARVQAMKSSGMLLNFAYLGMSKVNKCAYRWNEDIEIVQFAFAQFALLKSYNAVCTMINEKFSRYAENKLFTVKSLMRLLTHTVYINKIYVDDNLVDIVNAPSQKPIEDSLFWHVQNIIASKKGTRQRAEKTAFLPLSGKIFCGECGKRFNAVKDKNSRRYKCISHNYHKCDVAYRLPNDLDNGVVHGLLQMIAPLCLANLQREIRVNNSNDVTAQLQGLRAKKDMLQKKLDMLLDLFVDSDDDSVIAKISDMKKLIAETKQQITLLLYAAEQNKDDYEQKAITELVLNGSIADLALYTRVINQTIKRIVCNKDESIEIDCFNGVKFNLPLIRRKQTAVGQCSLGLPIYSVSVTDDKVTILYHSSNKTVDLPYDELNKTVLFADEHTEIYLVG